MADESATPRRNMFALLKIRDFRWLWASNLLSWQALWAEQLVFGWLALAITDEAWKVVLVGFFRLAPSLLGVFMSVITDRFDRRQLLIVLQLVIICGIGVLLALQVSGRLQYWHLLAVALINGIASFLDWPTRRALFPDIVGKERTIEAMLLDGVNIGLSWFIASTAGGLIMAALGGSGGLTLVMVLGCGSLGVLFGVRTAARSPGRATGLADAGRRLADGLKYVWASPRILGVLIITVLINAWIFPVHWLMSVFARDVLGKGPTELGFLAGAYGLGILVGLIFIGRVRRRFRDTVTFSLSCLLCGGAVVAFSCSRVYLLSVLLLLVAGMGHTGFSALQSGIVLTDSSDEMRGRAMAALIFAIGGAPLGSLQIAVMVKGIGAPLSLGITGAVAVVGILLVMIFLRGFVRDG